MKYVEFADFFRNRPLIDVREIRAVFPGFDSRRLFEWQKKGYVKKISRGFYVLAEKILGEADGYFIANKLIEPSYISLESALKHYSLIPEEVFVRTSVTTRTTRIVETSLGVFRYRKVKKELFFGFTLVESGGIVYKMAEPEKALLDWLYLRDDLKNEDDFFELRLNEDVYAEVVDQEKLNRYMEVFGSETLRKKVEKLNKVLRS